VSDTDPRESNPNASGPQGLKGDKGDPGPQGPAGTSVASLDDLIGIACESPAGPGTVAVSVGEVDGGYPVSLLCDPSASRLSLTISGAGAVTASPAPVTGSGACFSDGPDVNCNLWYQPGTAVTLTAVPAPGHEVHPLSWIGLPDCQSLTVCSFTAPQNDWGDDRGLRSRAVAGTEPSAGAHPLAPAVTKRFRRPDRSIGHPAKMRAGLRRSGRLERRLADFSIVRRRNTRSARRAAGSFVG